MSPSSRPRIRRAAIPLTRDPFVNTPLLRVTPDADGVERFWISSWNSNAGCTGVLVRADGRARIYRFPAPHFGFYSAVCAGPDTLWLCGDLSMMVRLTLSTGAWQAFPTGAEPALVFQGMPLDPTTGKLLAIAFTGVRTDAVSFDTGTGRVERIYRDVSDQHYLRASHANGDGTWSIAVETPHAELLRWDPVAETLAHAARPPDSASRAWRVWPDLPELPDTPGDRPTWFARDGDRLWGTLVDTDARVVTLDLDHGTRRDVCTIPDLDHFGLNITADGKIVAVNRYGEFFRLDQHSGRVEAHQVLGTDSVGSVDCLVDLGDDTLLGTPFISQRFWTADLRTGVGADRGRAAPGFGQVTRTWFLGGRAYFAAYDGGQVTEYDPAQPADFPRNPRVVARPPSARRPIAATSSGSVLVYSCTHPPGRLGCVITRYDTATGAVAHRQDPLPDLSIYSLHWLAAEGLLLAGTSRHADMSSVPPAAACCRLALLDPDDLSVVRAVDVPEAADEHVCVHGPLGDGTWLGSLTGRHAETWFTLSLDDLRLSAVPMPPQIISTRVRATNRPGEFVVRDGDRIELWDLLLRRRIRLLHEEPGVYHVTVQNDSIYLATPTEVVVLPDCLA